jgi:hypothetical protein
LDENPVEQGFDAAGELGRHGFYLALNQF